MAGIGTGISLIQAFDSKLKSALNGKLTAPETAGTAGQALISDGNGGQVWGSIEAGEVVIDSTLSISGAAADAGAVKTALNNVEDGRIDNTYHYSGLPVVGLETGSMYDASGIEYASSSKVRSAFIPVTSGDTLKFIVNSNLVNDIQIFEFTGNQHSASGVNNRIKRTTIYRSGGFKIELQGTTNYIRVGIDKSIKDVSGKVFLLIGQKDSVSFIYNKEYTSDDIIQGSSNYATGAYVSSDSKNLAVKKMIHLEKGAVIHFVPGTNVGECLVLLRHNQGSSFAVAMSSPYWWNSEQTYTCVYSGDYLFNFAAPGRETDITVEDYDCTLTVDVPVFRKATRTYSCIEEMCKDKTLQIGQLVETLGFNYPGDCGGGCYEVTDRGTANNCSVFSTSNDGIYVKRIFNDPYIYLESLNVENVDYSVITEVLKHPYINEVRCNQIKTSQTIPVGNHDFIFGKINYTGSGTALLIDSITAHKIKGDAIEAPDAEYGVYVTTTSSDCVRNIIEINNVRVKDNGLAIRPVNGYGIMHNTYRINKIISGLTGFSTYIPYNTGHYSWEGEELFTLNDIYCTNDNGTAIGVLLQIDPNPITGQVEDGTITGLMFTNLAVEYSNIGMKIQSGMVSNFSPGYDRHIKSIYVNNMRVRETQRTEKFLDGSGFVRDVYIKPTSPVQINQWFFDTSDVENGVFIDAPITNYYSQLITGYGIRMRDRQKYVAQRKLGIIKVIEDIDFSNFGLPVNDADYPADYVYFADQFNISSDLIGQTVNINLGYLWKESANGIRFALPGAVGGVSVTVNVKYMQPYKTITLTNTSEDMHIYEIRLMNDTRYGHQNAIFEVRDLGTPDQTISVPYNYDEDNA